VGEEILIVDQDEAFATMLQESLEASGAYKATRVTSADEALQAVVEGNFDLAIIDLGLEDIDAVTLIRAIREAKPRLRLMLIPLVGEELPPEVQELNVQGVLPKPFFIGDLQQRIESALKKPVGRRAILRRKPSKRRKVDLYQVLSRLQEEMGAEALLLMNQDGLMAYAGDLGEEQAGNLSSLMVKISSPLSEMAHLLGEEDFQQHLCEGKRYRLYTFALPGGNMLSIILRQDTPLGMVRYHARQAIEELTSKLGERR